MIAFPAGARVWIAGGVTDLRGGMNSLARKVHKGSAAMRRVARSSASAGAKPTR